MIRVGGSNEGTHAMRWLSNKRDKPSHRYLVDEHDGEVVGCIRFAECDSSRFSHPGWYYATSVHPDHRGEGRAKRLIEACARLLASEGVSELFTIVRRPETIWHSIDVEPPFHYPGQRTYPVLRRIDLVPLLERAETLSDARPSPLWGVDIVSS